MKIELVSAGVEINDEPLFSSMNAVFSDGDLVMITGDASTGKTTLFNLLRLNREPDSGRVLVDGRDPHSNGKINNYYRSNLAFIPEAGSYHHSLNLDNMMEANRLLALELKREDYDRRLAEGLKLFRLNLKGRHLMKHFSGSERVRYLLMLEMIRSPHVLLLDCALSSAGLWWGERIFLLLRRLCDDGMITIMMEREIPPYLEKRASRRVEESAPFRFHTLFRKEVRI